MPSLQRPPLPRPRGPVSEQLLEALVQPPHTVPLPAGADADPFADDDVALALYCCYELHYRGLAGVDDRWEWEPSLLAFRAALEAPFEAALLAAVPRPEPVAPDATDLALRAIIDADDAPSLSRFVETRATLEQLQEFLAHRSSYLLKEADPQTFAIPRLTGGPKAAMVEIQADEYGGGRPARVHQQLFADEMAAVGLDPSYGAYLDVTPAPMLAIVNLMSLLGLHRRHSAAMAGHLAAAEMTSSVPNRRYANGLRRLGLDHATAYHDEHVVADAVHENIAAVDLVGGLARQDPQLGADALWGAATAVEIEARFARYVWDAWERGECSLLAPLGAAAPA
ncbi:MAG TPA: iron-containing redox enzyme family protein [Solirubrobacteraceae bacterium]|jgi:hypothetical protein